MDNLKTLKVKKRQSISLRKRIILPLIILELLSTLLVCFVAFNHSTEQFESNIINRGRSLTHAVQYAAEISGHSPDLQNYIRAIAHEKDIKHIHIIFADTGEVIYSTHLHWSNINLFDNNKDNNLHPIIKKLETEYKDQYEFVNNYSIFSIATPFLIAHPLKNNIRKKAYILIDLDTKELYTQNMLTLFKLAVILCTVILLLTYIIYFICQKYIFHPLKQSVIALRKRAQGYKNTFIPIYYNDEIGHVLHMLNTLMSKEVKSIQKLQESEKRYKSLYQSAPIMLHTIDHKNRIIDVSKYWLEKMGYKKTDVLGKKSTDFLTNESKEFAINISLPQLKKTGESRNIPYQFIKKNGEILDVLLSATREVNKINGMAYSTAFIEDITERKKSEKNIEKIITRLTNSNTQLEQFAYIASHDLQEPLRMMISFADLLQEKHACRLDEKGLHYLQYVQSSAHYMHDLVNDLLEYARLNETYEKSEETNCNKILEYIKTNLQHAKKEAHFTLTFNNLPTIKTTPTHLIRLLQNLISNAIKYQALNNEPHIHVSAKNKKNFWLFSVCDNGIGIKEEYLYKIFEPFKRLHRREDYQGTGIGLAICKKIVENFGGEIWAESDINSGSTFFFTIPNHRETDQIKE